MLNIAQSVYFNGKSASLLVKADPHQRAASVETGGGEGSSKGRSGEIGVAVPMFRDGQ